MSKIFHKIIKIIPLAIALLSLFMYFYSLDVHRHAKIASATAADNYNNSKAAERFWSAEKYLKNTTKTAIKKALPYVLEFAEKINVSGECMKNSLHLMDGVKNIKKWAFQFLDASGKLPDGILYGSVSAIGHYKQCLDIEVKSTRKRELGEKLYQGQYCMIEGKFDFPVEKPIPQKMHEFPEEIEKIIKSDTVFSLLASKIYVLNLGGIRIGACVPTGCTKEDLNGVLKLVSEMYLKAFPIKTAVLSCETKEENHYTPTVISVLTFYSLIVFLVLAGSTIELYCPDATLVKSKFIRAILAFSLVTNFRKFCASKHSPKNVTCLSGLKFFSLTWVVLGHTGMAAVNYYSHGLLKYFEKSERLDYQVFVNGLFVVDNFFIIGSFLVAYLVTDRIIKQKKKFNSLLYVIHRLLRLYPSYITLLTTVVIIPLMSSGPFWKEILGFHLENCYTNWWANLLLINNYYHSTEACFMHTWYLTVDMQLYIFSVVFIIALIRWPKVGLSLIVLGIIGSILYCGFETYVKEYPPIMLFGLIDERQGFDIWSDIYFKPYTHLAPYGIGLLLGYFYAMNPDFKMSRMTQIVGWSVAFVCSISVLYGARSWYVTTVPQYLSVIYATFCRTAWSIGPAWIILCCATGHGGILNWFLSLRIFHYLDRITYSAYLLHVVPMIILFGGFKNRAQVDVFLYVWFFLGALTLSLVSGFILHLFIEVPFINLERIFLFEGRIKPESTEKENNIIHNGLKHEMMNEINFKPSEKDSSTKL